jgi:uncharacterized RDD family membrane protein YckC
MIAGRGQRFLAYMIDGGVYMLIYGITMVAAIILAGVVSAGQVANISNPRVVDSIIERNMTIAIWISMVFNYLIYFGVQVFFWTKSTSIGKRILRMYVVNKDTEERVGFFWMLLRETVGKFLSSLVCSLGFIWILFDDNRQGWHDKIVSSVVIKE